MFDAAGGVVLLLSGRVPTAFSAEKVFPREFEPIQTSKQPSAVVRPVSSFEGHYCPGVSRPAPADGDSSSVGSGFILPSLLSIQIRAPIDISGLGERVVQGGAVSIDATVACAALRLFLSTNRLSMTNSASVRLVVPCSSSSKHSFAFCHGLALTDIEIAFFTSFSSSRKLAVNSSGVRERVP